MADMTDDDAVTGPTASRGAVSVMLLGASDLTGELASADIDEQTFADHLYTAGTPDPDLLIRTSGEMRISNFLLWQISYAELVVTEQFWPDFGEAQFCAALEVFASRDRRFGKV